MYYKLTTNNAYPNNCCRDFVLFIFDQQEGLINCLRLATQPSPSSGGIGPAAREECIQKYKDAANAAAADYRTCSAAADNFVEVRGVPVPIIPGTLNTVLKPRNPSVTKRETWCTIWPKYCKRPAIDPTPPETIPYNSCQNAYDKLKQKINSKYDLLTKGVNLKYFNDWNNALDAASEGGAIWKCWTDASIGGGDGGTGDCRIRSQDDTDACVQQKIKFMEQDLTTAKTKLDNALADIVKDRARELKAAATVFKICNRFLGRDAPGEIPIVVAE